LQTENILKQGCIRVLMWFIDLKNLEKPVAIIAGKKETVGNDGK
jgi:hypothetical protein